MTLGPLISGHLDGPQITAYADGQVGRGEGERIRIHLKSCTQCARAVEREAWLKVRLGGLNAPMPVSARIADLRFMQAPDVIVKTAPRRRRAAAVAGASAVGFVFLGGVALGTGSGPLPMRVSSMTNSMVVSVTGGVQEILDTAERILGR